jgi:hypothetical protein
MGTLLRRCSSVLELLPAACSSACAAAAHVADLRV